MMGGQLQEGQVTLTGDDRKEPAHLVLGEKGNLGEWRGVLAVLHESDSIAVLSDWSQGASGYDRRTQLQRTFKWLL